MVQSFNQFFGFWEASVQVWCEIRSPHNGATLFLILIFATISGFWLRITLIYCRDAWRLFLEDPGGSSCVRKTTQNYGLGRCCNYDLKRLRVHGDSGSRIERNGWDLQSLMRKLMKFWEAICRGAEKTNGHSCKWELEKR
jgi:hypothetical protein